MSPLCRSEGLFAASVPTRSVNPPRGLAQAEGVNDGAPSTDALGATVRLVVLAAAVNSTVMADENLTVGSTSWLPAESLAPGR